MASGSCVFGSLVHFREKAQLRRVRKRGRNADRSAREGARRTSSSSVQHGAQAKLSLSLSTICRLYLSLPTRSTYTTQHTEQYVYMRWLPLTLFFARLALANNDVCALGMRAESEHGSRATRKLVVL